MFRDRQEAAQRLADKLRPRLFHDPVVLAIPRGGVVIGAQLARTLRADLDVVLVRKLRSPQNPDQALGALAEDGTVYLDPAIRAWPEGTKDYLEVEKRFQARLLDQRKRACRAVCAPAAVARRSAIITDDGLATGASMISALHVVRDQYPLEVIVAVPVCSPHRIDEVRDLCDDLIFLVSPQDFTSIDQVYRDFRPVSDEEVLALLRQFSPAARAALRGG